MPGLDPGIHEAEQQAEPYSCRLKRVTMDCRVKPGNDSWRGSGIRLPRSATPYPKSFMLVLSSNTVISGALPEKPSSFQRAATCS